MGVVTSRIASVEQTVNALSAKMAMFAEMEQNVSALTARMCKVETYAASAYQMYAVPHDPGLQLNRLTAPQLHGPMAQDHLMTTETHDEDLILFPAPKMSNHGVPFYYDSLANNTSKDLQS